MEQVIIKINHFIVIMMVILFTPQLHSQDLPCKEKFKNGQCYKRYLEDQDGNIHGKLIVYDENGLVLITANYNHGVLHGLKKGKNIFGEWIYEWYHNDEKICSSNQPISSLEEARKIAAYKKVQEKEDDWKSANQDSVRMINMNGDIFYKTFSHTEKIDRLKEFIDKYPTDNRVELAKSSIKKLNEQRVESEVNDEVNKCLKVDIKTASDKENVDKVIAKYSNHPNVYQLKQKIVEYNDYKLAQDGSPSDIDKFLNKYSKSSIYYSEILLIKKLTEFKRSGVVSDSIEYKGDNLSWNINKIIIGSGYSDFIYNKIIMYEDAEFIKLEREGNTETVKFFKSSNTPSLTLVLENKELSCLYTKELLYKLSQKKLAFTIKIIDYKKYEVKDGNYYNGLNEVFDTYGNDPSLINHFFDLYKNKFSDENIIKNYPYFFTKFYLYFLQQKTNQFIDIKICKELLSIYKDPYRNFPWANYSSTALTLYIIGEKQLAISAFKERMGLYIVKDDGSAYPPKYYYDTHLKEFLESKVSEGLITKEQKKEILKSIK